jgi:hypothetical protein
VPHSREIGRLQDVSEVSKTPTTTDGIGDFLALYSCSKTPITVEQLLTVQTGLDTLP